MQARLYTKFVSPDKIYELTASLRYEGKTYLSRKMKYFGSVCAFNIPVAPSEYVILDNEDIPVYNMVWAASEWRVLFLEVLSQVMEEHRIFYRPQGEPSYLQNLRWGPPRISTTSRLGYGVDKEHQSEVPIPSEWYDSVTLKWNLPQYEYLARELYDAF